MLSKKDGISLFVLIAALVLINIFGAELDSMMWARFTLLTNCFLAQGVFITLVNVFRMRANRSASKGLILLALVAGFISLAIIIASEISLLNRILLIFLQAMVTYAEALLLRKEIKSEDGRKI
ncbi:MULTISPECIES: hypothetical protein [unclassified Paenibacillus]|uniref:hypothetical protein n=1 Tax=unclassified Paenibacillus TaxID=185978 RepID=UPI0024056989|nr:MULTISPECIES: hypothetical protein [unclassified Paenibacillus]MDF9842824.1 hypothetical protein [Paenibacillus sp. PastF-2]MDF9849308.1 hypothetical protein [Paenibacillus sp. PastM-2]MDF9855984.1 hypothetical protein [Paenibacillus sp. PastF-1]MDH6481149.1 hypothetical protein [Paenibacillus sp. PastH-2]MDH6508570.1 hypothetical protein [Paenibacillus sp. PastM-3]